MATFWFGIKPMGFFWKYTSQRKVKFEAYFIKCVVVKRYFQRIQYSIFDDVISQLGGIRTCTNAHIHIYEYRFTNLLIYICIFIDPKPKYLLSVFIGGSPSSTLQAYVDANNPHYSWVYLFTAFSIDSL